MIQLWQALNAFCKNNQPRPRNHFAPPGLQSTNEAHFFLQRCSSSTCSTILSSYAKVTSSSTLTTGATYSQTVSVSKGTHCFRAQACTAANVCSAFSSVTVCRVVV